MNRNGEFKKKFNIGFITIILLLSSCFVFAIALSAIALTADQAVSLVEKTHLPHGKDEVMLYVWGPIDAGTEISSIMRVVITAPAKGYVVFIDDHPTASFSHPVRYAFVYSDTEKVVVADAWNPPLNFEDYQMIETSIGKVLLSVENRRPPLPKTQAPKDLTRVAVLMNGGAKPPLNWPRYYNNLCNIYITLNYVYGFADENIIVLCSDGLSPLPDQSNGQNSDPDLDEDGDDDIMYSCTRANVEMVFNQLAENLTPENKVFVFITDHGVGPPAYGDHYCYLWDQVLLRDSDFADLLNNLPQCEIICTFGFCFSGGFLDDVVVEPGPRVASSACRGDEESYGMPPNYEYDEYLFHWTAAVKGEDAYGNPVFADINWDGTITMNEAFQYAEAHDTSPEHPQYGDYPTGIGEEISLGTLGVDIDTLCGTVYNDNGGPLIPGIHYLVTCDIEIPLGEILTIQPGAEVYFKSGYKIIANGMLSANGELANPVRLLSQSIPHRGMKLHTDLQLQNGEEFKPGD